MAKRQDQASLGSTDSTSDAAPERMCAVTRESGDARDLIRFVLSPDGIVVPDLERKLPGRGVWVGCSRMLVEKAIRTQAFSKSLKTKADAPADLAERVDNLILKRTTGALSLANKAGLAVAGFEKVFAALEKGPVRVVLHGADAAADGRSKIDRKYKAIQADRGQPAAIVDVLTIAQMSLAIGRGSVVHAALTPGGLSDRFLEEAERLARYRHSTIEAAPGGGERISDFLAEG
ncbi:RNA-binding protein [Hyphomicrobium sp.]|uniref:RNA-binding protein n=1 Tax=Hyphomicrobium sp. TaxID=82 RepID=UPI000FA826D6|nr:RNA-binding protein [Hyphomicrobium sp.]RUP00090.1 MAG: RNA-binding protein [Hyphomicrobium sp.]